VIEGQTQVLEAVSNLSDTWAAVNAVPNVSDGVNKVTLPITTNQRFFRVRAVTP
jgi:hypothetical protein